ncbi:putative secreted hydrolase [Serinicoccus hydrothermalis]|uniref:Putative secreted hydrolase n=1 Tax=Serinicoccus hydrothermalis TaxID=1758689 RepID=A0A1B1NCQ3_9MICO|nr:SGNH/GDSL hydrolase family protein [Serinicoccus hydrothermalis]ANS79212.1 putative secreted hydrolase [Serinicoccus hydrothermalis]
MSTTTRTLLAAGAALAVGGTLAIAPSSASSTSYVALGDSFSAGTGTYLRTDSCYRSPRGYPELIARAKGLDLDYQACSGAQTADVLADQLGTLGAGTGHVSMTIGGNDVGFADVITACALPGWLSDCDGEIDDSLAVLRTELPGRLDEVYGEIADRAPNAAVAIAGYPYLFNGRDCSLLTFFSRAEMTRLNDGTAELDQLIADRSAASGFTFVEVRDDFAGHAVCDRQPWVNNLSLPIDESFHPNRAGNQGYAAAIAPSLVGSPMPVSRTATTQASPVPDLRAQADAVLDLRLDSKANLRQAKEAGLRPGEVRRAVAKLRSSDEQVVRAGLVDLQALDAKVTDD